MRSSRGRTAGLLLVLVSAGVEVLSVEVKLAIKHSGFFSSNWYQVLHNYKHNFIFGHAYSTLLRYNSEYRIRQYRRHRMVCLGSIRLPLPKTVLPLCLQGRYRCCLGAYTSAARVEYDGACIRRVSSGRKGSHIPPRGRSGLKVGTVHNHINSDTHRKMLHTMDSILKYVHIGKGNCIIYEAQASLSSMCFKYNNFQWHLPSLPADPTGLSLRFGKSRWSESRMNCYVWQETTWRERRKPSRTEEFTP